MCDIKELVLKLKFKCCDKVREVMDFLIVFFSGENVKKLKVKFLLVKKFGFLICRILKGYKVCKKNFIFGIIIVYLYKVENKIWCFVWWYLKMCVWFLVFGWKFVFNWK